LSQLVARGSFFLPARPEKPSVPIPEKLSPRLAIPSCSSSSWPNQKIAMLNIP